MPSPSKLFSAAVLAGLATGLTACAGSDYVSRDDRVTVASGDAVASAKALQGIDPWPANVTDTNLETDGRVAVRAVKGYTAPKQDAPQAISIAIPGLPAAGGKP